MEFTEERHCRGTSNSHPDVELNSGHAKVGLPSVLSFIFCMMLGLLYVIGAFFEAHGNR